MILDGCIRLERRVRVKELRVDQEGKVEVDAEACTAHGVDCLSEIAPT